MAYEGRDTHESGKDFPQAFSCTFCFGFASAHAILEFEKRLPYRIRERDSSGINKSNCADTPSLLKSEQHIHECRRHKP